MESKSKRVAPALSDLEVPGYDSMAKPQQLTIEPLGSLRTNIKGCDIGHERLELGNIEAARDQ